MNSWEKNLTTPTPLWYRNRLKLLSHDIFFFTDGSPDIIYIRGDEKLRRQTLGRNYLQGLNKQFWI